MFADIRDAPSKHPSLRFNMEKKIKGGVQMINEREKSILSKLISKRLIENWNKCDQLASGSAQYDALTDECTVLHGFVRENAIYLPQSISSRF